MIQCARSCISPRTLSIKQCESRKKIVFTLCVITTIMYFVRNNRYIQIPKEKIQSKLYKATVPHLAKRSNIDCKYDEILTNTESVENWKESKTQNFSTAGIVNGSYIPEHCNSVFSVAILVTYRNRTRELNLFLTHMHFFLRKQNIHYKIYVIEQRDEKPWNKGLLYNIGALQAIADKFPCLILHDVDMLPLDERNLYVCTCQPRHMSVCVDKYSYALLYSYLVGGVLAIRSDQFTAVDGFSNRFYAWGGEDDDFATRMSDHGLQVWRFPCSMSRYTMLFHQQQLENPKRHRILTENRRISGDGFKTMRYNDMKIKQLKLFTWVQVIT